MTTSTATSQVDRQLEALHRQSAAWAKTSMAEKRDLLLRSRELVGPIAEYWVEEACKAKGISLKSPLAGEEWLTGPYAMLTYLGALAETVGRLAEGQDPLKGVKIRTRPDGRLAVRALPHDLPDRLFLSGFSAELWLRPGVTEAEARERQAHKLRSETPADGVYLVLGAGNINATAPLDVLYKLYAANSVVLCKLNPVNDYMLPILEHIFEPFIKQHFVALTTGDATLGAHLTSHDLVSAIHITGSNAAHDAIVFGPGLEGSRRRLNRTPILRKPITSELGGVGATVVVPGPWSQADLSFQAAHVATQKLHNGGFNCTASQIVVLPDSWNHSAAFLAALRKALQSAPQRPSYYPGAEDRVQKAATMHPEAELLEGGRLFAPNLDPLNPTEPLFQTECFAPVQGVTSLPGDTPQDFLESAIAFCNEGLAGTLGVNLIIHPRTIAALGKQFDEALVALRYGTVAVNAWTSVGYLTPRANWGAFPGHELHDVGSGIGASHNALLLDDIERTIIRGPFRPAPRALFKGEWTLSPKPPWFVDNKTAHRTSRRVTQYAVDPSVLWIPPVVISALRG